MTHNLKLKCVGRAHGPLLFRIDLDTNQPYLLFNLNKTEICMLVDRGFIIKTKNTKPTSLHSLLVEIH